MTTTITIALNAATWDLIDNLTCEEIGLDRRAAVEQLVEDGLGTVFQLHESTDVQMFDRVADVEAPRAVVSIHRLSDREFEAEQLLLWGTDSAIELENAA